MEASQLKDRWVETFYRSLQYVRPKAAKRFFS